MKYLCVFYGCSVPVLIRKAAEHRHFVGETYVHGLMDGEAIQQSLEGTIPERLFILR